MGGVIITALGGLAWLVLSKPKPDRILVPPAIDLQGQDALRKGFQAERDRKYPEAEKQYRVALGVKPGRSDLQLDLARSLVLQGKQKRLGTSTAASSRPRGSNPGKEKRTTLWPGTPISVSNSGTPPTGIV